MTKQQVREEMKIRRRAISFQEREERNQKIRQNLLELEEVRNTEEIFPFVSYGTEVDTIELITLFLQQQKRVAVPKVSGKDMDFYKITALKQLQPGYQGILEPAVCELMRAEKGVMLLPGLAFDRKRNRIGYGGGFYDRYLAEKAGEKLITVAAAYDFQVVDNLPAESFDWKPDIIVTDCQVIRG